MKKILVVIDMQNDFLTGSLANPSAVDIIPNINRELNSGKYDKVYFTKDTHNENYLKTQEGKNLPIEHCIESTYGWEISSKIDTPVNVHREYLCKDRFAYQDWEEILKYIPDCEIYLTGTCTDICVISNALAIKDANPEVVVKCIADCCAPLGGDESKQNAAFSIMESCQIEVIK